MPAVSDARVRCDRRIRRRRRGSGRVEAAAEAVLVEPAEGGDTLGERGPASRAAAPPAGCSGAARGGAVGGGAARGGRGVGGGIAGRGLARGRPGGGRTVRPRPPRRREETRGTVDRGGRPAAAVVVRARAGGGGGHGRCSVQGRPQTERRLGLISSATGSSAAGCSTRASTRLARKRAVRTVLPPRVISLTSTTPRPWVTLTRRPARVAVDLVRAGGAAAGVDDDLYPVALHGCLRCRECERVSGPGAGRLSASGTTRLRFGIPWRRFIGETRGHRSPGPDISFNDGRRGLFPRPGPVSEPGAGRLAALGATRLQPNGIP